MYCKITKKKIKPFMSFGKMPIANGFLKKSHFKKEYFFNMEVGFSKEMSLFQLNNHPAPKQMFNKNYPFFTSSSKGMVNHFKSYANWVKKKYQKNLKNLVEIGSNDGTFLKNFKNKGINLVGFEPSKNVCEISRKNGIKTMNKFFNYKNVKNLKNLKNKVNIITAANAICHVPDLISLIKGIDFLLDKKGLFIFEEPYLGAMYEKNSYDQIYDEHIFMFSASSIKKVFNKYGFELIDAIPQKTHGGSMRYVVGRVNSFKVSKNVSKILRNEKNKNIDSIKGCKIFKKNCEISKKKLLTKLNFFKKRKYKIAGYAATSKSTTILNYCNIGVNYIDYICDTTKEKIGKYSPGMHIPIVSMNYFKKNIPDKIFLFAWNHKKEILKKENKLKNKDKWFAHIEI
ncbi:class I SAM-dependent methyltransferase [Candidatus Pelagibacter sp.]|nr:class I SAM-dependent methyltransferase [Candidatus Pelagibacter sp.]